MIVEASFSFFTTEATEITEGETSRAETVKPCLLAVPLRWISGLPLCPSDLCGKKNLTVEGRATWLRSRREEPAGLRVPDAY